MTEPLLKARLQPVARRQRRLQLGCKLAACWTTSALLSLGLLVLARQTGWASPLALPVIAVLTGLAALRITVRHWRSEPDWRQLARQVEARHPELDGRLLTAVQQVAAVGSTLSYLQERVVAEALLHSRQHNWARVIPFSRMAVAQAAHLLALLLFAFALWGLRLPGHHGLRLLVRAGTGITVTPGDTTLERGETLVVLTRFGGTLPASVDLVLESSPETSRRVPLIKSLADPVFGGSVPEVTSNLVYHIEYAGQRTRDYRVSVFEHPQLERADAELTYPAYTGQAPRRVESTRRLSAVEGSRLDLSLQLNKPVATAQLVTRDKDRTAIPLTVEAHRPVAALKQFPLVASQTYDLQLVDADGRTNKVPAQFVFDVLKNRPPELRVTSPRGDTRPSALEELSFEGTVWDDFGVQAYGLAYTLAGRETRFVELGRAVAAKEKRPFQYLLRLEELGVQPDQLVSWFVWADDIGPDAQVRRTTGDLYFAEVRPFEEIFREGQDMDGQSQQAGEQSGEGNQAARLAELQKQIISATWKLQREHGGSRQARPPGAGVPADGGKTTRDRPGPPKPSTGINPSARRQLAPGADRTRGDHVPGAMSARAFINDLPPSALAGALHDEVAVPVSLPRVMGQRATQESPVPPAAGSARARAPLPRTGQAPKYEDDAAVVRDSQAQALEQAETALERQQDPRTAALYRAATREMEQALARLKEATGSPAALAEALAAEQAAYQALLKLQQREYEVARSRNRNQRGNSSREQQMQRQLDQLDLTQSENRYETQRQAQAPPTAQRREQLQVMNRLQELARRQQDVNERLKELQTALQEARTEQEREDIRRRLKRLQEEEQQMLADVDELRQRMDRPENQSSMTDQRRQLDQTRNDVQRAAEAAAQGSASQALAAGTRAQRQLQQLRDDLRKENSSAFAEDLRQMRADARELARQEEEIRRKMDTLADPQRRRLSASDQTKPLLDQLTQQKQRLTNLVERATQVSGQAQDAEPLLSRQLYDALRKYSQDDAATVKDLQEELLANGLMSRNLYERLRETAQRDGAKSLEATAEMLRQGYLPQADRAEQQARARIDDLKRGVEHAAESVLGDDTEALRFARQQLDQLTDQLEREAAQAQGGGTNQQRQTSAPAPGQRANEPQPDRGQQAQAQARDGERQSDQVASAQPVRPGTPTPDGRDGNARRDTAQRNGAARGGRPNPARADGNDGGGRYGSDLNRVLDRDGGWWSGPITGEDFAPWSDGLREVEEMVDMPDLRNEIAQARERARLMRQEYKRDLRKPDWAVVRLEVIKPLVEVRNQITEELARREPKDNLVPIDRDPVPSRYSDLVRRYYEELGKDK